MKKSCNKCRAEKEVEEFYASSPNTCKACVLKRQKELKDKRGGKARKATGGGQASKKTKRAAPKTQIVLAKKAGDRLEQIGGLGFIVELEVDEATGHTDIHLEQTTPALGAQNLWLSRQEARALLTWLTQKLPAHE